MSTPETICQQFAGKSYRDHQFRQASAAADWNQVWPEIDRDGTLTGRLVGDEDGFLNVDDEAVISASEARAGGWTVSDGYAEPPMPRRWPTIRNCNFSTREDDCGRHVYEALVAADRGTDDADLIGALDDLDATLAEHAERDDAESQRACVAAEESVEAAMLAINAAFETND